MLTLFFLLNGERTALAYFKVIDEPLRHEIMLRTGVNEQDIILYRDIFSAIRDGKWQQVDNLQKRLGTTALNGHLFAEKYLHKDYISTYEELQDWLKKYPYLPQYPLIKSLSIIKAPGYNPPKPQKEKKKLYASYDWYKDKYNYLSAKQRAYVRKKNDEFLLAIRQSRFDKAEKILSDQHFREIISIKNYDDMAATLASAYFLEGDNKKALSWSREPIIRSKNVTALWFGGLAAWNEKKYQLAADYFQRLAKSSNNDKWIVAAGAYWAYRTNKKLRRNDEALSNLRIAASYPRTFYGILAKYILSNDMVIDWRPQSLYNRLDDRSYKRQILSVPSMRRALLLIFAGENELAERDFRYNYNKFNLQQKELLMFIAAQYSLPNLSYITANQLKDEQKNINYDSFMYPLPEWSLKGEGQVNPAWIWALVRQESLFLPSVQSHAGACGLMQIMPETAVEVTGNKNFRKDKRSLFDKDINLSIGQDYVTILKEKDFIGNNLVFLAASYNAGPHNLKKWIENVNYEGDPLLFIEMIPWKETRLYVKKVITNYWIYSSRLGYKPQSLSQLAHGHWPLLDEKN